MLQEPETGYLLSLAPFPEIELPKIEWGFCLAFFDQFQETTPVATQLDKACISH